MDRDWAGDVKKYVPDADDSVIKAIVRYCGIALHKLDSSLVSFSDPVELGRVRQNFLRKKLALTDSDEVLDAALARVGERMKGDRTKNRVTVYYLLLEDLGLLHMFRKAGAPAAVVAADAQVEAPAGGTEAAAPLGIAAVAGGAAAAAGEGAGDVASDGAAGAAGVDAATASGDSEPVQASAMVAAEPPVSTAGAVPLAPIPQGLLGGGFAMDGREGKGGFGWLIGLLLGALLLLALVFVFRFIPLAGPGTGAALTPVAAASAADAPAPDATVAVPAVVPDGAGVVSATREAKPVVKVYFDTGKADVAPTFAGASEPLKAWLAANPDSVIAVSGYNDPTGNAAANAALSKRRAQAIQAALVAAGVPAAKIELVKPAAATDAGGNNAEARRVEVYIK